MHAAQDIYPSRVGEKEKILERQDPVVYGAENDDDRFTLSADQLAEFDRNGYLVIPDYMPESVTDVKDEIQTLKQKMSGREELVLEPDSDELRSMFALHKFSGCIEHLVRSEQILKPVRQILGSDVYLMQSRLNIKPAYRGKSFPWHSDFETWHVEDGMPRMRAVTAWLMLTENNEYNGPLYVVPGSHKSYVSCSGTTAQDNHKQSLRKQIAGVPEPKSIDDLVRENGVKGVYGKPGTLVIHECNLLHGSPDNLSPWPREILMFVYNSTQNKVVKPFSGMKPRPEYLSCREQTPLQPV